MSVNPAFERYCELAIQLQRVELLSLSREEKLAFFINIYNALVIHGYLRLGAPTNMWQRYRVRPRSQNTAWKVLEHLEFLTLLFRVPFSVLQLRELPDRRRSFHLTGHRERRSEGEQKGRRTAAQAFLQNRPTTTSIHTSCQITAERFSASPVTLHVLLLSTRWLFLTLSRSFTLP